MPRSPSTRSVPGRPRRSNAERSAETRSRLLEATIECLIERGHAGTTTLAVCRRAGVSHGALLHHFGRREHLLGAALEAVQTRLRGRVVDALGAHADDEDRLGAMVEVMWRAFGAREFKAVLELWLAARNHPEFGWSIWSEAEAFDAGTMPLAARLFPEFAERVPDFEVYVSLVFQVLQGMGLAKATLPGGDRAEEMRERVRALTRRILLDAFGQGDGTP